MRPSGISCAVHLLGMLNSGLYLLFFRWYFQELQSSGCWPEKKPPQLAHCPNLPPLTCTGGQLCFGISKFSSHRKHKYWEDKRSLHKRLWKIFIHLLNSHNRNGILTLLNYLFLPFSKALCFKNAVNAVVLDKCNMIKQKLPQKNPKPLMISSERQQPEVWAKRFHSRWPAGP